MVKKSIFALKWAIAMAAVISGSLLLQQKTWAAAPISVVVNNEIADMDVPAYFQKDTVMVPLGVVQKLPGVSIAWNNATKTVTVQNKVQKVSLLPGQNIVTVGGKKVTLPAAVVLEKGRVMVPLRFISETAGAHVQWVPGKRTVYVAKASTLQNAKLASSKLWEARGAAIDLPRIDTLKSLAVSSQYEDDLTDHYYFPEGESKRFFVRTADWIRYYVVAENRSELKWTANLDLEQDKTTTSELSFLPYPILVQDGKLPATKGKVAFFEYDYSKASTTYGMIDGKGQMMISGQKRSASIGFYEIDGEASEKR